MSALISFAVENVRSYRGWTEFSMLATRLGDPDVARTVELAHERPIEVLPAAALLGANAAGKSTLLKALADMRSAVLGSFRLGSRGSGFARTPFLLDETSRRRPSTFDVELVLGDVRWQYRFSADDDAVVEEHAYHYPNGRQALVFTRSGDDVQFGPALRKFGRAFSPLLRPNALVLSVAGAAGVNPLSPLFEWFQRNLWLAESSSRGMRAARTAEMLDDPADAGMVRQLLMAADLGLVDIERRQPDPEIVETARRLVRVLKGTDSDVDGAGDDIRVADVLEFVHACGGGTMKLDADEESRGTMVWVALIGPVLDALRGGHVLLADELDASLHPHLVRELIELFQRPGTNPNGAQLIFNAHDVTVLETEPRLLRRDQIWFAEKAADGATTLVALAEFAPRRDEAIDRRYLVGRYGGVPTLSRAEFARAVGVA